MSVKNYLFAEKTRRLYYRILERTMQLGTLCRRGYERLLRDLRRLPNPKKAMPIPTQHASMNVIDEMIPPQERIIIGAGDFKAVGDGFKKHFIELAGLKPNAKVLDVGCGIGRMAVPLTQYLSPQGEYWGFDIVKDGIDWCVEKITPRFPNFHFHLSDVHNKQYNPNGKYQASDYKFPYQDNFFDFVFLTSVFTHMLPKDLENYLSEIARVLKPGGKSFITYFLLNPESMDFIERGATSQKFHYDVEGALMVDKDNPEYALAYPETTIKDLYKKYDLKILEPIYYGNWCRRKEFLSYQDIVIASSVKLSNITSDHEMIAQGAKGSRFFGNTRTPNGAKIFGNRAQETIIGRYAGQPFSDLSYATVRDFCDSADHLSSIMRFDGDLKDVQRAWMVKAILGRVPLGGRLLEIGGGEPLVANALQELGYDVTIIDPYDGSGNGPQLYDHFRRLYPRVNIIKAYFEKDNPALAGKQYEGIFSISVLEHVPHDKLSDLFTGIAHYLTQGGQSIHCIDHIVAGFGDEFSSKGILEMLCGQKRIQNPGMPESEIRQLVEEICKRTMSEMSDDIETYYHSALGHNLWRTGLGLSYDKFPFRKVVSIQTCVDKK